MIAQNVSIHGVHAGILHWINEKVKLLVALMVLDNFMAVI